MIGRILAAGLASLAIAGPAAAAAGGCHEVEGTFVAAIVPPGPDCSSFAFCTVGTLEGDLEGTYFFSVTGFTPEGALTAQSTITLTNGAVIEGSDTSVIHADGTFTTTVGFVGGTRQFAHATGGLVADGHFTATGGTEGTYAGEYCLGSKP